MHPNNLHQADYNFSALTKAYPALKQFITHKHGKDTIDFSLPEAVLALNKAILAKDYDITNWDLPEGYLCPPIPGRVDYIHYLNDLLDKKPGIKGLDIGVGANAIYPLLGFRCYGWQMVGSDVDTTAIKTAKENTKPFKKDITILHQRDRGSIFKGVIMEQDYFDFTMCNPPFYASEAEAIKANKRKREGLEVKSAVRNFGGQANELWCNGGEALFIKRMIKESILFKEQVGWFTCLLSRKQHLPKILKQLSKLGAHHHIIEMKQGQKKSRIIAWQFIS